MSNQTSPTVAPGGPGIEPRWTRGAKIAVGTAYSTSSRVWYTLDQACITEVYYPTIDSPQIRDFQFLITDGETFFHDERRNLIGEIDCVSEAALGFEIINREKEGRYTIHKTVLGDPHQTCLLVHTRVEAPPELLRKLRMYVLCAPHLEIGGWHNNGEVLRLHERTVLTAHKGNTWLVIGASIPLTECSVGYVGVNDGWTDLADNYRLDWRYDSASDGNIALTGGLDLSKSTEFTIGLAFGTSQHDALSTLVQSLSIPFEETRKTFIRQWERTSKRFALEAVSNDSKLFERSVNLLLAHEDKTYPGAMIASLSIPWGDEQSDDATGGYHLVWTRDLVKSVSALLSVGDLSTPLRALIYLAVSQREDGAFHQNFWIDGRPYWSGIQLDEVAFPVLLAWRLWKNDALGNFDPFPTVRLACGFLIREGPITPQDRWEEARGYSPSTLAVHIVALVCAAEFFADRGDDATAAFVRDYADFLESHIEQWTVTTEGTLVPGITQHYIRVNPCSAVDCTDENPNHGTLILANQPPGARAEFPAKEIVDAGFLELVRYGLRNPHDPIIQDSLRVVDAVLRVDTPYGPAWRRYNHDGFGQREDGSGYTDWGRGRPWPLLTGERGHYEIAAGRDATPFLRTMENFAQGIGLIPEQIWDRPDLPSAYLRFGGPTNSAMPLLWAHSEYLKLQRSAADGKVFDRIEAAYNRYVVGSLERNAIEVWKFNRQVPTVPPGALLRIQADMPFLLHWTSDEWQNSTDTQSQTTALGIEYADIRVPQNGLIRFTFLWIEENRWEGKNYDVKIASDMSQRIVNVAAKKVLVLDIGGTFVKVYAPGHDRLEIKSGPTMTPERLVRAVKKVTDGWEYDAISAGYPGPVLDGKPQKNPANLGKGWVRFDFVKAFGVPVKIMNDAAMQALGTYRGGRMLFLGLGTGLGSALIVNGALEPLELAHLPYKNGETFEQLVGAAALNRLGEKKWTKNVFDIIEHLKEALQVEYVALGGGNSKRLMTLPADTIRSDDEAAREGGVRLWN
ncbi:MAG TPA: glycoside hydrolase family 15 protein [Pyrinomonadaceae bacterium]|jgi:glucoamylase|nr:glycoside hydrolase family 15 protein [Pyrinomonadaceae bacterium]